MTKKKISALIAVASGLNSKKPSQQVSWRQRYTPKHGTVSMSEEMLQAIAKRKFLQRFTCRFFSERLNCFRFA
jgi:hypothetical protein